MASFLMPSRRVFLFGAAIVTVVLLAQWVSNSRESDMKSVVMTASEARRRAMISNSTLGFEKIFVLSLPERSDRRDAMSLMASVSGMKLEYIDGYQKDAVVTEAAPLGWDFETMRPENLASWRGHLDAIRRITEENLSSALILEDDLDWDVSLKSQLFDFANATSIILETKEPIAKGKTKSKKLASPYGDNWDILWLGACMTGFRDVTNLKNRSSKDPEERQIWIEDPHIPINPEHMYGNETFDWSDIPPRTRIVHNRGNPLCTWAYALTGESAAKALYDLAPEANLPFDLHLQKMFRERAWNFKTVGVVPSLFEGHLARGSSIRDSNIEKERRNPEIREIGLTHNVLYSTRLNIANILAGKDLKKQWDN